MHPQRRETSERPKTKWLYLIRAFACWRKEKVKILCCMLCIWIILLAPTEKETSEGPITKWLYLIRASACWRKVKVNFLCCMLCICIILLAPTKRERHLNTNNKMTLSNGGSGVFGEKVIVGVSIQFFIHRQPMHLKA